MLESPLLFGGGYVLVVTCPILVVDDDSLAKFRIRGVVRLVFTVWLDRNTPADKISLTPDSATWWRRLNASMLKPTSACRSEIHVRIGCAKLTQNCRPRVQQWWLNSNCVKSVLQFFFALSWRKMPITCFIAHEATVIILLWVPSESWWLAQWA